MSRRLNAWPAVFFLALLPLGCAKTTEKPKGDGLLPPILEQWSRGDRNGAVKAFVETDWSQGSVLDTGSEAAMSEKAFREIPPNSQPRDSAIRATLKVTNTFRELAERVTTLGREAIQSNDITKAKQYLSAVKTCCDRLDPSEFNTLVTTMAKVLRANASRELDTIGK